MLGGEPPEFEPPVTKNDAIESAKEGINSNQEPSDIIRQEYPINEEESKRVWNVTFGEPDNKEVIVDAETGEILSIRNTGSEFDLNKILEFFKKPYSIIAIILILIVLIGVIIYKRRKTSTFSPLDRLKID